MNNQDVLSNRRLLIIFYTFLGLFAGLTNENTVIVFIALYLFIIIYRWNKKEKIYLWIWSSFVTLIIGFITMFIAPSTSIRVETYKEMFGINDVTIKDYIYRAMNIIYRFFMDNKYYIILLIGVLGIYLILNYKQITNQVKQKHFSSVSLFYQNIVILLITSLSVGALIGAPYVETRAFFIADTFMLVCIVFLTIEIIKINNKCISFFVKLIIIIFILFGIKEAQQIYVSYLDYSLFVNQREENIINAKRENKDYIIVDSYNIDNNRLLNTREEYIQSDSRYLDNYYDIQVIYNKTNTNLINESTIYAKANGNEIINGIDYIEYDKEQDILKIYGWAGIENKDSKDGNINILLKSDKNLYKFSPNMNKRIDVSEYYGVNLYDDTGFYLEVKDISYLIEDDKYNIGFYIENKLDNTSYIYYTSSVIEIY